MKNCVVGFIFNSSLTHVLLMHKLKPEWQKGHLNGLGGKIEEGEDLSEAMTREIKEESNLDVHKDKWVKVGRINTPGYWIDVFGYIYPGSMDDAQSMEVEKIEWFEINNIPKNTIHNVPWLIPLVKDKLENGEFDQFEVHYT